MVLFCVYSYNVVIIDSAFEATFIHLFWDVDAPQKGDESSSGTEL